MAMKRIVSEHKVCDPCGRPAETFVVDLDGEAREVELCTRHARILNDTRAMLAKYGRKPGSGAVVEEAAPARRAARKSAARAPKRVTCGECGEQVGSSSQYRHAKTHGTTPKHITWTPA